MTIEIRNAWQAINNVLTIINLFLFMVLTAQGFDYKEVKGNTAPIYLNVLLLIILGFAVYAGIYSLLNS